jgi:transcription elongation factor Elf1
MAKFHIIEGKPDNSTAGQVRKRTRQSARDWPACPHCGGRATIVESTGNVKNKLCSMCAIYHNRRVVIE